MQQVYSWHLICRHHYYSLHSMNGKQMRIHVACTGLLQEKVYSSSHSNLAMSSKMVIIGHNRGTFCVIAALRFLT